MSCLLLYSPKLFYSLRREQEIESKLSAFTVKNCYFVDDTETELQC